jgi:hypothetical protein
MPAARAGTHALTTTVQEIYNNTVAPRGCTQFEVVNPTTNTVNVLINIPSLHGETDFHPIPPDGIPRVYTGIGRGITLVRAKSASATPSIYAAEVAK